MKSKNIEYSSRSSGITDILSLKAKRRDELKKISNTDYLNLHKFKQVESDKMISFKCPTCHGVFGLETEKLEGNEANIHYFCPYCGLNKGLE